LLQQLLKNPGDRRGLVLWPEAPGAADQVAVARQLLALANLDLEGTRRIVFGAEPGVNGARVHGLEPEQVQAVALLAREMPCMIEPPLRVSAVILEIDGRRIAALEVDGCENPPYVLRNAIAAELRTGACWVQDEDGLRPARRADLDRMYRRHGQVIPVRVGIGEDPDCQQWSLAVPDTSEPPSRRAQRKLQLAIDAKKTAAQLDCDEDTAMARLAHARIFGVDEPYVARGIETLVEQYNASTDEFRDQDEYFFREQRAVKFNCALRNVTAAALEDAVLELMLPHQREFLVCDRLYREADAPTSDVEQRLLGYPEVRLHGQAAAVQVGLGCLEPGETVQAFETALRIAVGPGMRGRKVAVKFRLNARGLDEPLRGRLKLNFSP
jgi:hypothetical protein